MCPLPDIMVSLLLYVLVLYLRAATPATLKLKQDSHNNDSELIAEVGVFHRSIIFPSRAAEVSGHEIRKC